MTFSLLKLVEKINTNWKEILLNILNDVAKNQKQNSLIEKLVEDMGNDKPVYPPLNMIFNSMTKFNFEETRIVIIGQDPYHTESKAMGLSFSVPEGEKLPPSLKNIFKELETDIEDFNIPTNGDLTKWSSQGVLLLNSALTVVEGRPNSHQKEWIFLTDEIISHISNELVNVVFMLWGNFAKDKKKLINTEKHLVLEATHPSPLSAHRGGWFGCKHFSKANTYLDSKNKQKINWLLE
jgi:uracil-DNA glycosylase